MVRHGEIRHEVEDGLFVTWDSTDVDVKVLKEADAIAAQRARELEKILGLPELDEPPTRPQLAQS